MGLLEDFARQKGFRPDDLTRYGVHEIGDAIAVPYHSRDGSLAPRYQLRNGTGFTWNAASEEAIVPYGLDRPVSYASGNLIITEGASDCWALWNVGIPALGLPGATTTNTLTADMLTDVAEIGVVREPDEAGQRFPIRVANRCTQIGFAGRLSALDFAPYKDPRDAMIAHPTNFRAFVTTIWKRRTPITVATTAGPTYHVYSAAEFTADPTPMAWIVDQLWPEGGSLLLSAPKGGGKSTLLTYLARCIARGEPFLGRAVRSGRVLYVSLDEPKKQTEMRAKRLGIGEGDAITFVIERGGMAEWVPFLREQMRHHDVLLIDTFAKLLNIGKIESYGEWNQRFAPLHALAQEFGWSWGGTAHNHKYARHGGNESVTGSNAFTGAFDTVAVLLKRIGGQRTIQTEDQRAGDDIEATVLRLHDDGTLTLGERPRAQRVQALEDEVQIVLRDGIERSGSEIAMAVGRNKADVLRIVADLASAGIVTQTARNRFKLAVPEPRWNRSGTDQNSVEPPEPPEPAEPPELPYKKEGKACGFFWGSAADPVCARCGYDRADH